MPLNPLRDVSIAPNKLDKGRFSMFMNVESGSERTRSGKYAMQMDVANEKQDGNWIIPSHTKLEKEKVRIPNPPNSNVNLEVVNQEKEEPFPECSRKTFRAALEKFSSNTSTGSKNNLKVVRGKLEAGSIVQIHETGKYSNDNESKEKNSHPDITKNVASTSTVPIKVKTDNPTSTDNTLNHLRDKAEIHYDKLHESSDRRQTPPANLPPNQKFDSANDSDNQVVVEDFPGHKQDGTGKERIGLSDNTDDVCEDTELTTNQEVIGSSNQTTEHMQTLKEPRFSDDQITEDGKLSENDAPYEESQEVHEDTVNKISSNIRSHHNAKPTPVPSDSIQEESEDEEAQVADEEQFPSTESGMPLTRGIIGTHSTDDRYQKKHSSESRTGYRNPQPLPRRLRKGTPAPISRADVNLSSDEKYIEEKIAKERREARGLPKSDESFQLNVLLQKDELGIQGFRNSCYMDSSLMSLFLYDTAFLDCIKYKPDRSENSESVQKILYDSIAIPLSSESGRLSTNHSTISEFRNALGAFDKSYLRDMLDPEEFLTFLFETVLGLDPFYLTVDGGGGHVYQTYGDFNVNGSKTSVQKLLDFSLKDSGVLLKSAPRPGLIIKMPVTNGKHLCSKIIPELIINLGNISNPSSDAKMRLRAIVCLQNNHFTTFVRTSTEEKGSIWIYLDSFEHSEYQLISNLDEALVKPPEVLDKTDSLLNLIFEHIYLCIYLPILEIIKSPLPQNITDEGWIDYPWLFQNIRMKSNDSD